MRKVWTGGNGYNQQDLIKLHLYTDPIYIFRKKN